MRFITVIGGASEPGLGPVPAEKHAFHDITRDLGVSLSQQRQTRQNLTWLLRGGIETFHRPGQCQGGGSGTVKSVITESRMYSSSW